MSNPEGYYFGSSARGGYAVISGLSKTMRAKAIPLMRFRQFGTLESDFSAHKGDRIYFNKYSRVASTGQLLTEFDLMPMTHQTVSQDSIIVYEYGMGMPITERAELLTEQNLTKMAEDGLLDGMAMYLDSLAAAAAIGIDVTYVPTGNTTAPSSTLTEGSTTVPTTATRAIMLYDVKNNRDTMRKNNIKAFENGDYMTICSTSYLRGLEDDPDFENAARYGDPQRLFDGEVGRISGVRHIRETAILDDDIGSSSDFGEGLMFGFDYLIEAVALPEEFRVEQSRDFGRNHALAWLYIGGFKVPWTYTNDTEYHGIFITSDDNTH